MKMRNPFSELTKFEWLLYCISALAVVLSALMGKGDGLLSTFSSFIGVTALIFVARGDVFGQVLTVVFSILYAIVSYEFKYYGEMITYVGMTAPIAAMSIFSWAKNPYKNTTQVKVARLSKQNMAVMTILTIAVTVLFYFILKWLGTATLLVSTFSIATSFLACYLQFFRSPYYAVAYACNDIVLITLWTVASVTDIKYISMVVCFSAFLANDIYGFINWKRMQKNQLK